MKKEFKIELSERKLKMVVQDLNKVLDEHKIFGSEFNKEVLQLLIMENLSRKETLDLIKRLEAEPISNWND